MSQGGSTSPISGRGASAAAERERQFGRLRRWLRWGVPGLCGALALYVVTAYVLLPRGWRAYERHRRHPALVEAPRTTFTFVGERSDPLNVALVGTEEHLVRALLAAGWRPADPTTFRTGLRIAEDVLRDRPYPDAPVSDLYLYGRKEDLAFEQLAGHSPRRRHHVRFWRAPGLDAHGRPLYMGAATFDRGVGLARITEQITHHIAPDIDAERDKLIADLRRAGQLAEVHDAPGVGPTRHGRTGGGDAYYTDGMMAVGVLRPAAAPASAQAPPSTRADEP